MPLNSRYQLKNVAYFAAEQWLQQLKAGDAVIKYLLVLLELN